MRAPTRGEVWLADFGDTVGREQAGLRPALIVSPNRFNQGPLVVAVPFTTTNRGSPLHVRVRPPSGGLRSVSFAMCEQVRSLSRSRLHRHWGELDGRAMAGIAARVRLLIREF
jgi:mRNA interferase MazF